MDRILSVLDKELILLSTSLLDLEIFLLFEIARPLLLPIRRTLEVSIMGRESVLLLLIGTLRGDALVNGEGEAPVIGEAAVFPKERAFFF